MDTLRAITLFVRAAAAGSFQRVAVDEAISPQAVSKAIAQLERHLGVRLFHRTTRRSSLTSEGLAFLESVKPALDAIDAAVGRARAVTEAVEGPLRVTTAHSARRVLMPAVAEFAARHPGVQFELVFDDGFTDLVASRIDVGLRFGRPPEGQVIVRHLFDVQLIVCAAPAYLQRHGAPRRVEELAQHRCSGFRLAGTGRLAPWELMVDGALRRIELPAAICTNDAEAELDVVLAGVAIGLVDGINGAAALRDGRLVPLLLPHVSDASAVHLYYPERSRLPRRVRAFIDFAVERLRDARPFRLEAAELQRLARRHGVQSAR